MLNLSDYRLVSRIGPYWGGTYPSKNENKTPGIITNGVVAGIQGVKGIPILYRECETLVYLFYVRWRLISEFDCLSLPIGTDFESI